MNSKHIKNLTELIKIPSISAQSAHNKDIRNAAEWIREKLAKLDFSAEILKTKGHPVVYAEKIVDENAKTILIYGHYDVQAPDPIDQWDSDPFTLTLRSGNMYGRGTADDKGQLYTWIAALSELQNKKLAVNIKFLIEGEEEVGSEHLDEFVKENASLLKADICLISDSHALSPSQPLIDYGLRGLCYMQIHIKTLGKDGHSGLYGGNVLNPAIVLSEIISKLKNSDHTITIPHFYDNVRTLSQAERKELAKFPMSESDILEETGASIVAGEDGFTHIERAGARPTLDVNGMWSGYTGEGPKTIIPAEAYAKISMRLVPNQDSRTIAELFTDYVKTLIPKGVELEIQTLSGGEPIIMNKDSHYFKMAEKSLKKVFGNKPLYTLSGGSIPVTATFKQLLEMDSILIGYGLPDDGLHSPNEKLSIEMFEKGIETNKHFLNSFS